MKSWAWIHAAILIAWSYPAVAQSPSHIQTARSPIASAVWAGEMLYVSGTPGTSASDDKRPGFSGDTKSQTARALSKIATTLKDQGLTMADVIFMRVYLVGDPAKNGKMDFAGMNDAFKQFFGTNAQPNKPARTTIQVAGLASPGALVEIDVVAQKSARN